MSTEATAAVLLDDGRSGLGKVTAGSMRTVSDICTSSAYASYRLFSNQATTNAVIATELTVTQQIRISLAMYGVS